jgi:pilus assembly protein CpaF
VTGLSDNIVATQELYRYEPVLLEGGEEQDNWVSLGIHPSSPKLAKYRQTLGNDMRERDNFNDGFGRGFGRSGGGFNV